MGAPDQSLVEQGTFTQARPEILPNSFHCASDPSDVARVEDRTSSCSRARGTPGLRTLDRPDEMRRLSLIFSMLHAGAAPCMWSRSAWAAGQRPLPARRGDHRLGLRGGIDADHDEDGGARAAVIEDSGSFVRACTRSVPPLQRARRMCGGRATPDQVHLPLPRARRSGPTVPATAGTRCSARSATRCGSPRDGTGRRWLAEHMLILKSPRPMARRSTSAAFPSRAARPTWPCCSRPSRLEGRDRRRRHRLDAVRARTADCTRSTEAGFFGVAPEPVKSRNANAIATVGNSIFTRRADRRRRRVVGGPDRRAARAPDDWKGPRLDTARPRPPPTPTPGSHPGQQAARSSRRSGRSRGRADLGDPVRRPARQHRAAGDRVLRLAHGVFLGANIASEKTRPPRARSGNCA